MTYPAANLRTVRRLEREYRAATTREMNADDVATAQRLALVSDRVSRRLAAARNGITIEPPRTRRNLAIGAFAALAAIGRVIARALTRAASLRRASLAAAVKHAARKALRVARRSLRRAVQAVVALVVAAPSVASAHPGHGGEVHMPPLGVGVLVITAAVLAGLASHAWDTWGPRRRALATIDSGELPAPGGDPPSPETDLRKAHEALPQAWREALPAPYYTVRIPYVAQGATEWHPTQPDGPLGALTRGVYSTLESACAWADEKLGGAPYSVAFVSARLNERGDDIESVLTTVYTHEDLRVIAVGDGDPGDECEHTNEHGDPCHHRPRQWSIRNGSGYVVACDAHAHALVEAAILDGDIYPLTR